MRSTAATFTGTGRSRRLNLPELGKRAHDLRRQRGMSLEDLKDRSGVSRSMNSAIERGSKAATVLILDRIATALDTSLARLLTTERPLRVVVALTNIAAGLPGRIVAKLEQPTLALASRWRNQ